MTKPEKPRSIAEIAASLPVLHGARFRSGTRELPYAATREEAALLQDFGEHVVREVMARGGTEFPALKLMDEPNRNFFDESYVGMRKGEKHLGAQGVIGISRPSLLAGDYKAPFASIVMGHELDHIRTRDSLAVKTFLNLRRQATAARVLSSVLCRSSGRLSELLEAEKARVTRESEAEALKAPQERKIIKTPLHDFVSYSEIFAGTLNDDLKRLQKHRWTQESDPTRISGLLRSNPKAQAKFVKDITKIAVQTNARDGIFGEFIAPVLATLREASKQGDVTPASEEAKSFAEWSHGFGKWMKGFDTHEGKPRMNFIEAFKTASEELKDKAAVRGARGDLGAQIDAAVAFGAIKKKPLPADPFYPAKVLKNHHPDMAWREALMREVAREMEEEERAMHSRLSPSVPRER